MTRAARQVEPKIWSDIVAGVREQLSDGDGFWRSCSGCYETVDGQNVHGYPHSKVFGCELGSGCGECGGIGAIWDTTNYRDMADGLAAEMEVVKTQVTPEQRLEFLIGEIQKALESFDRMPLQQYFDRVGANDPIALAILAAYDHLAPALHVLGINTKQLTSSQRPEGS